MIFHEVSRSVPAGSAPEATATACDGFPSTIVLDALHGLRGRHVGQPAAGRIPRAPDRHCEEPAAEAKPILAVVEDNAGRDPASRLESA